MVSTQAQHRQPFPTYVSTPPPQTTSYFISPPTNLNGTSYLMTQAGQPPSLTRSVSVVQQHLYPLSAGSRHLPYNPRRRPNQPVVVPINRDMGGYLVVPAQGVTIVSQQPQYQNPRHNSHSYNLDSSSERGTGGSFFGSLDLKNTGTKARRTKKLRKHTRTGSY